MITHGMNIDEVRAMAEQMRAKAEEVRGTVAHLSGLIADAPWQGPDAEQFKGEWEGTHAVNLNNAANALLEAGERGQMHAEQQEAASAA